jgi:uncharacterized protein (DUF736 family)
MSYDNTNTGVLFPNDQGDNPKRPNYKGSLNIGGKEYEIAAWNRTAKSGREFISLKVEEKTIQQRDTAPAVAFNPQPSNESGPF